MYFAILFVVMINKLQSLINSKDNLFTFQNFIINFNFDHQLNLKIT